MKTFSEGDRIEVGVGEIFALRRKNPPGGYLSSFVVPDGIELITEVPPEPKAGDCLDAVTETVGQFRCEANGEHELIIRTGRPWEEGHEDVTSVVICGRG